MAQNKREGWARRPTALWEVCEAAPGLPITGVDPGSGDTKQHLAWSGCGTRHLLVGQDLWASIGMDLYCFHRCSAHETVLSLAWASRLTRACSHSSFFACHC